MRNLALSLSGTALLTIVGLGMADAASAETAGAGASESASAGTAATSSGAAAATGNQANTNANHTVTVSGNLGTIHVVDQKATVTNAGEGTANTGSNISVGNGSRNGAAVGSAGGGGGSTSEVVTDATNASDGSGSVSSGAARSVGNESSTSITQDGRGNAEGRLGGILVVNQHADVANEGAAAADSGSNAAVGNASESGAGGAAGSGGASAVSSVDGRAVNGSDGTASVTSGDADAVGNRSTTTIDQRAGGTAGGALGGVMVLNQHAATLNSGSASASSGGNGAAGNGSKSSAALGQGVEAGAGAGDDGTPPVSVASANGEAANGSDGTATITTGDADAFGNESTTVVRQDADGTIIGRSGVGVVEQDADVVNRGEAAASSGQNLAVGNASWNDAAVEQYGEAGAAGDVSVAGDFGLAENTSDGSATITTGDAVAIGNRSSTTVEQGASLSGATVSVVDQDADVVNEGVAWADSGNNEAIGNDSRNDAEVLGAAVVAPGATDVAVSGTFELASNTSDGTASVTTGGAAALGSQSTTDITQSSSVPAGGVHVADQDADVVNTGVATANSGHNTAVGNASTNGASVVGEAVVGDEEEEASVAGAAVAVASNNGEAANGSGGTATVTSGAAAAGGNVSDTSVDQDAGADDADDDGVHVVGQSSSVTNEGSAWATSGGNVAVGNGSQNGAAIGAGAVSSGQGGGALVASNDGLASNSSSGSATITTGDALAVGNTSTTTVGQAWVGGITEDGVVYMVQKSAVVNQGLAYADTGLNAAVGNASSNGAQVDQGVGAAGGATTSTAGTAANTSTGTAMVTTGIATAVGNDSTTTVVQTVAVTQSGSMPIVVHQISYILNVGVSASNTGGNLAIGNLSWNEAGVDQAIVDLIEDALLELLAGASGTAAVSGTASNTSDGSATVVTGAATAEGNKAVTTVRQSMIGTVDGAEVLYIVQESLVLNFGVAMANSGQNVAVGNLSDNEAWVTQVSSGWVGESGTSATTAVASNTSTGTAVICCGTATAVGNRATTTVVQLVEVAGLDGPVPFVVVQSSATLNIGLALSNTGGNLAVGNASQNRASVVQTDAGPGGTGTVTAVASNTSSGTAVIGCETPPEPPTPPTPPTPPGPPAPPAPPTPPPAPPEVAPAVLVSSETPVLGSQVARGPAAAVSPAGALPYTGGDVHDEVAIGLLLFLSGLMLQRRSRRRGLTG